MKYSKLYNFKEMNSYQFIAVTGLVMTLAAHIILILQAKEISSFWALYLCWVVVFILGSISNFRSKPGNDHHHHHHH
jgi:hypothetical protein